MWTGRHTGLAAAEPHAPRRGDADAHAGEAAGAGGDADAIDPREIGRSAFRITRAISGIRASAWPRAIAIDSRVDDSAQFGVEHGGRTGFKRGVDGEDLHACLAPPAPITALIIGRNLDHLGHEMLEQVLDAVLQCRGR